jgi:DeoR/GlpR family transcriptional regulator of sugar metabolism
MSDFDHNASGSSAVPARRRDLIAAQLRANGSVTVAALEAEFGISPMTARRDLHALERQGRARRTHGGAIAPSSASREDPFRDRMIQASGPKERLGRAASRFVEQGEALFVDSSTTAYFAVRGLLDAGRRMTVLTNSLPVMELMAQSDDGQAELIGLGGSLRKQTRSFVGPATIATIERHFADKLLFSVNGFAPDGVLTEADPLEAEVKRAMVGRSAASILMLDGSKFERAGLSAITDVRAVDLVLVADVPPAQMAPLKSAGVELEVIA